MSMQPYSSRFHLRVFVIAALWVFTIALDHPSYGQDVAQRRTPPQAVTSVKKNDVKKNEEMKTLLFIGDSLTAGYGVKKEESFPERIGVLLQTRGHRVKIINGGISGSVTAEADRRVKWFLRTKPDILFLSLGANDALKGTPPKVIKANLEKAIDLAQSNGIRVVLGGIRIFSNYGADYGREFEAVYKELAAEKKLVFVPFLLDGVALKKDLNQPDGKHPNAKGHEVIAENLTRVLEPLL